MTTSKHYPVELDGFKVSSGSLGVVVQNTWYTVVQLYNVRLIDSAVTVAVASETVEMRITVDGTTYSCSAGVALTAGGNDTTHLDTFIMSGANQGKFALTAAAANVTIDANADNNSIFSGANVLIEARKTTAVGAATLAGYTVYHQLTLTV